MKISLYPTAKGCYRPPQAMQTAREYINAGKRVAISSVERVGCINADGPLDQALQINDWNDLPKVKPHLVILDNLYFLDPDGLWIFDCRPGAISEWVDPQEDAFQQPARVSSTRFRYLLEKLTDRGTEEVILVSEAYGISPAWHDELTDLEVDIHWECADFERWRSWQTRSRRLMPADPDQPELISAYMHGSASMLLMLLVAEFNDIRYGASNPQSAAARNPDFQQLMWLMADMFEEEPEERVQQLCTEIRDHLILLSWAVEGYINPEVLDQFAEKAGSKYLLTSQNLH